ncbi:hypothetical protein [Aquabacterium sp.]|uniref:hypothetical protein n=1 Tax=Aquabacterium sp. TaxID=1872578 RepID=UPI003783B978
MADGSNDMVVAPFQIDRICKPQPSVAQLALKDVDTTETVYTRILVELKDASLPDAILYDSIEQMVMGVVSWDLFLMLKYRQDWRATGYGLGELLHTVSLMPNEELTLELKTWETSKTQQDEEVSLDEKHVSDIKNTSSSAKEATAEDQTKTHEYVDAKAGYSGFGFDVSVKAGWSQDVSDMHKDFAKQTQERSEQATNETRASRKVKIAVSRETGSEAKTTRKIKNINQAHTLNVNYFEVLREYTVSQKLYEAVLVVLGQEPDLLETRLGTKRLSYPKWPGMPGAVVQRDSQGNLVFTPTDIRLGEMIRLSGDASWLQEFTDRYGVSPIKLLREMWAAPLFYAAPHKADWTNAGQTIDDDDREAFRSAVLQHVRPCPGWIAPDDKGALRWGYEVVIGQEQALLQYLYPFLPYSVQQVKARALAAKMEPAIAYDAIAAAYAKAVVPSFTQAMARVATLKSSDRINRLALATGSQLHVAENSKIMVRGPFLGKTIAEFGQMLRAWIDNAILSELARVRQAIAAGAVDSWTAVLPTQSVYSDLSLGICSGAEDYYEVQRQFDLELKQAEIQRLHLELEKLKLENQLAAQGTPVPSLVVQTPTGQATVNVDVQVPKTATQVAVQGSNP